MGLLSREKEIMLKASHETMLPIVITGTIGSGKSTVAQFLANEGRDVYDPDTVITYKRDDVPWGTLKMSNQVIVANGDRDLENDIANLPEHIKIKCFRGDKKQFFTQYILVKPDSHVRLSALREDLPVVLIQGSGAKFVTDIFIERHKEIKTTPVTTIKDLEAMLTIMDGRMAQEVLMGEQNYPPIHFHVDYTLLPQDRFATFEPLTRHKLNSYVTVYSDKIVTTQMDAKLFLNNVITLNKDGTDKHKPDFKGIYLYIGKKAVYNASYTMLVETDMDVEMMLTTLERRRLNGAENHSRFLIDAKIADQILGDLLDYNDTRLLEGMKVRLDIVATEGSSAQYKHIMNMVHKDNIIWEVK